MTTGNLNIISNPISAQYEAVRDSEVVGLLAYNKVDDHLDLRHTFVRKDLRGQQIGHVLVAESLQMIRAEGHIITASCSYVATFIEQHPEFADLVDQHPIRTSSNAPLSVPPVPTDEARLDTKNVYPDGVTTSRLTLRPWMLDDVEDAFRIYGDLDVTRWSRPSIAPVADCSTMLRRLDGWIRQSDHLPRPQGRWAVELTDSGALVGGAHLLALREQGESRLVMSWELDQAATDDDLHIEVGHALAHSAFSIDPDLTVIYAFADAADERALAVSTALACKHCPDMTIAWTRAWCGTRSHARTCMHAAASPSPSAESVSPAAFNSAGSTRRPWDVTPLRSRRAGAATYVRAQDCREELIRRGGYARFGTHVNHAAGEPGQFEASPVFEVVQH